MRPVSILSSDKRLFVINVSYEFVSIFGVSVNRVGLHTYYIVPGLGQITQNHFNYNYNYIEISTTITITITPPWCYTQLQLQLHHVHFNYNYSSIFT